MGVHGLERWIDERGSDVCNLHQLPAGCRVLIDGSGLCFHLLRGSAAATWLGDYAAFGEAATALFSGLRLAGLSPEVFLDGPASHFKSETLRSRRTERDIRSERLQAKCLDGACFEASEMFEPPMMWQQLAASADAAGVPVRHCEGEADVE